MTYPGDPYPYSPSHKREVSASEQWLIDRAAETFLTSGKWPKLDRLTREAARSDIELPDVIVGMPMQDFLWRSDNDGTIVLSITGLWRSPTGARFVGDFLKVALLCRDIYLEDDDSDEDPRVTSEDVRSKLGLDDPTIARIKAEMSFEYFLTRGGGATSDTEWYYFINPTVAKFKNVATLDEYFKERAKIVAPKMPLASWPPGLSGAMFSGSELVPAANAAVSTNEMDPRNVFVVHGRDVRARDALWRFLERLGLHPLDWNEMVRQTGKGTPYTGQVLEVGFAMAVACVVLMTPDDEARLHTDLIEVEDPDHERELTCQPRPNVIFEAGRAFGTHSDRTIIVEIGSLRQVSDMAGLNVVRIGKTKAPLQALADRLEAAGCPVQRSDPEVFDPSQFAGLPSLCRTASTEAPKAGPAIGRVLSIQPSERGPTPSLSARLWDHGKDRLLELVNRGDVELEDIQWEIIPEVPNWFFMTDALPAYPIPTLAPQKHLRIPVVIALGGPAYVSLHISAISASGEFYETTEQLSIYG